MTIKFLFILSIIYTAILLGVGFGFIPSYTIPLDQGLVLGSNSRDEMISNKDLKDKFEITFFDVGQGDSIYMRLPTGERLLVDGGGFSDVDYKIDKKFVFPNCHFNHIFLTHPHLDHYGGLKRITQHCDFDNFTFNDVQFNENEKKYFSGISTKNSILIGDNYSFKDVIIKVMWPDIKNTNVDYSNVNNLSVILFIDYGDYEALLTGDAEYEALEALNVSEIAPLIQNGLDIYKVSHHGAKNGHSETLIQSLKPLNCVISVGKNNKYGHPNSTVVSQLEKNGCTVYRTDESGDITFIW